MNLCNAKLSNDKMKSSSRDKVKKCNQCNYASTNASTLKDHIKTHTGAKPNKCQQCDYASSQTSHLRTHLKAHSGEKPNRCNQCQYASSHASNWGNIWKRIVEKSQTSATSVTMHPLGQTILRGIWRHTAGKSQTNQCDFTYSLAYHLMTHRRKIYYKLVRTIEK